MNYRNERQHPFDTSMVFNRHQVRSAHVDSHYNLHQSNAMEHLEWQGIIIVIRHRQQHQAAQLS